MIHKGIGNFLPGVGMIGGALKLAGSVFNPSAEDSDLTSMRCELQSTISSISSDLKTLDMDPNDEKDTIKLQYGA